DAPLLVRLQVLQRAHVVQAVGKLDQHDAHVRHHRQQHLADVLGLARFRRRIFSRPIFVTPATKWATSGPKRSSIRETGYSVSSMASWRMAAVSVMASSRISARMCATSSRCDT